MSENSKNKSNLAKNNTKGFSTALLLNFSPLENNKDFNEPIENNRLNISANAIQSDSQMNDFLSLDLLEKIDSISPFEKNKENKKKIKEKNFGLNEDNKLNSFSLNSSGSNNEGESIEIIDSNDEKKPILFTMKKINDEKEVINNNNDYSNNNNNINSINSVDSQNKYLNFNSNDNNISNNNLSYNYYMNNNPNKQYENYNLFNNSYNLNNNINNQFFSFQPDQNKCNFNQQIINSNNNNINNVEIYDNKKISNVNEEKQKKIKESDYIIEMFGKVGWICEQCNNFNYDTRNKCNRCGIPKSPKKISKMKRKNQKIKNELEKLKEKEKKENNHKKNNNLKERKGDWFCAKCANLNFSFRVICNRCNFSKIESEKLMKQNIRNYNIMNLGNINFNIMGNYNSNNFQNFQNNMQLINNGNIYFNRFPYNNNNYLNNNNNLNNNNYNDFLNASNINNYNNNIFYQFQQ